jgi:hypothetical protein
MITRLSLLGARGCGVHIAKTGRSTLLPVRLRTMMVRQCGLVAACPSQWKADRAGLAAPG